MIERSEGYLSGKNDDRFAFGRSNVDSLASLTLSSSLLFN